MKLEIRATQPQNSENTVFPGQTDKVYCCPPAHTVDDTANYPPARIPTESYVILLVCLDMCFAGAAVMLSLPEPTHLDAVGFSASR